MLATSALRVLFLALLPVAMAQTPAQSNTNVSVYCQANPQSAECNVSGGVSVGASQRSRQRRATSTTSVSAYCQANPESAECQTSAGVAVGASQRSRMRRAAVVNKFKRGITADCTGGPGSFGCEASVDVGAGGAISGASARARSKRDTKQLEFSSCPTGFKACAIGNVNSESYECIGNWEECTA